MVEKQELLTQDGYNKLEEELEYLKTVKRKEVAERLKVYHLGIYQKMLSTMKLKMNKLN